MLLEDPKSKQKLTLTVSKDAIERAKKAGINISEVTEQILNAITLNPSPTYSNDELQDAYIALFSQINRMLSAYGDHSVGVGEYTAYENNEPHTVRVEYDTSAGFYTRDLVVEGNDGRLLSPSEAIRYLYPPMVILRNFIECISQAAAENKEKMKELEYALRIVKALAQED